MNNVIDFKVKKKKKGNTGMCIYFTVEKVHLEILDTIGLKTSNLHLDSFHLLLDS